ncbi:hypothetical protein CDEST_11173 [Colletotrichum destructivum]|uniref:Uncharacterized protein n=1 Tax=Colletotrichum destructivum TaxID=34406 RepID=A0AAX4ISE9_9PEZI|nr:hypothetical protein CDEST_11173 [Colletotrichum destructivum]
MPPGCTTTTDRHANRVGLKAKPLTQDIEINVCIADSAISEASIAYELGAEAGFKEDFAT